MAGERGNLVQQDDVDSISLVMRDEDGAAVSGKSLTPSVASSIYDAAQTGGMWQNLTDSMVKTVDSDEDSTLIILARVTAENGSGDAYPPATGTTALGNLRIVIPHSWSDTPGRFTLTLVVIMAPGGDDADRVSLTIPWEIRGVAD